MTAVAGLGLRYNRGPMTTWRNRGGKSCSAIFPRTDSRLGARVIKDRCGSVLMSAETFVQRVVDTVEKMESTSSDVLDYVALRIAVGKLRNESESEKRPLSAKEDRRLRELAIKRLNNDDGRLVLDLAAIIADGGYSKPSQKLETGLTVDVWHRRPENPHPFEILVSLLAEAGVIEQGEVPVYYELGRMGIGTMSARKGALLLTTRRLLCVGFFGGFMGASHRIYYDDWQEKPWVSSLDYVVLERLQAMTTSRREITAKYRTKHVTSEEKTIGAGLYLFRFGPPDQEQLKEGEVDIHIVLDDMKGYDSLKHAAIPPDYLERRQLDFLVRMQQLRLPK